MDIQKELALQQISDRGVFIVGHARSGTTVLQHALNASPDAFIFGEANFHNSIETADFGSWYNSMHKSFENPPAKGDRCPMQMGNGWDMILHLSLNYRLIGDKLAFRSREFGYNFASSYQFLQKWFLGSAFLCTLREPTQVILSNRLLFGVEDLRPYFTSYLECLAHEVNTYLTFDRSFFIVYEAINQNTFDVLGRSLGIDLNEAYSEYDVGRQSTKHGDDLRDYAALLDIATNWYTILRDLISNDTLRCPDRRALRKFQREMASTLPGLCY